MSETMDDAVQAMKDRMLDEAQKHGLADPVPTPSPPAEPEPEEPEEPEEEEDEGLEEEEEERQEEEETYAGRDPELDALLARYGGNVDEALRGALEAQKLIGRQGDELRQLREYAQAQAYQQPPPPEVEYDADELGGWFDENPLQIPYVAADALQRNDIALYNAALEAWHQHAPRQAAAYERQLEMAQLRADMQQQLAQVAYPVVQRQVDEEVVAAWTQLRERFPEISDDNFVNSMLAPVPSSPELQALLQQPGVEQKYQALERLAWMERGRRADTLATTSQDIAAQEADTNRKAKKRSAVASATATPARSEPDDVAEFKSWLTDTTAFKKAAGLA